MEKWERRRARVVIRLSDAYKRDQEAARGREMWEGSDACDSQNVS